MNNYMQNNDPENDKDYQKLVTRLVITGIIAILAFGATKLLEHEPVKGIVRDSYVDTIHVRTNDAELKRKIMMADQHVINEILKEKNEK